ncbi:hypothetical protein MKZ38_008647 [Zalerion maritima]|uniref:Zn(2)-C6 fungal-type domain-containing protein n=1 Tax=Zalerion maritima TaxID=339359 RepID=A0AAD5S017_9PEZI|nr:hypothetical protein MKZ38_008647 [Zalerion maritima]
MNNNIIKKRRPYCREGHEPLEKSALQDISHHFQQQQQQPLPPSAPSLQHQQPPPSPLDSFPNHQRMIIQQAASILEVPIQSLLDLKESFAHSRQQQQQQQQQPSQQHPPPPPPPSQQQVQESQAPQQYPLSAHPPQHSQQQQPGDSLPQGPQFKRPRLSDSTSDSSAMFFQRHPQTTTGPSQDLQGKSEDQTEGAMVVSQRPYNLPPGALTTVTLSISNCMGNIFCPPFEGSGKLCPIPLNAQTRRAYQLYAEYASPLAGSTNFGYGPNRPYEDSKPPATEQPFDISSSAPSEVPQQGPPTMFTAGPMDDGQLSYLPHYSTMQPTPQGTLTAQPSRAEEMVYAPMESPMGSYFGKHHSGTTESSLDGGSSEGMMHVTNPESAVIAIPPSGIPCQEHSGVPGGALITAPSRQGSVVQHGPPTSQQRFPGDNAPYIYGHNMYSAQQYPGYDVVWPPGGRPPSAKRGPFKNNADREKTAQTRRIGSCIRCRMQRIRCNINDDDERGPCLTCAKVANSKIWRLPCLRYKITDIQLFKPGKQVEGHEWTRRWTEGVVDDIANWESMDVKVIHVSEGFSRDKWVNLEVRKFIPQEGDKLERSWIINGTKRSVIIPPYAICDTHKAKDEYQRYIDETIVDCFNAVLGPSNRLLQRTYRIALARSLNPAISEKERKLLQTTLRLWMSIRLTTRSAIIVGDETLGMSRNIMDATSPIAGKIPLPPVMGAQIDLILINQIQKQWRKDALEMLQDMVQNNKQKTWMTTYLVTYMLLHNTALITAHDASYAEKHGIPRRFAREAMVGKYHEGANVLLAYWHYCNKSVYPFSKQCKDSEFQQLASLDEATMQFIRVTREIVNQEKPYWNHLQAEEESEDDYYFISQMYEENWKPRENLPIGSGPRAR